MATYEFEIAPEIQNTYRVEGHTLIIGEAEAQGITFLRYNPEVTKDQLEKLQKLFASAGLGGKAILIPQGVRVLKVVSPEPIHKESFGICPACGRKTRMVGNEQQCFNCGWIKREGMY